MSRIGKKIIQVPAGVTVNVAKNGHSVEVQGKLGKLTDSFPAFVIIKKDGDNLNVEVKNSEEIKQKAMWGTARAVLNNMVEGVDKGFSKELTLTGVGYKMELAGNKLTLYIGFSHPVIVDVPEGIKLELKKNVLTGTSHDKQLIGDFFSKVHNMKIADPYKHKGFKFPDRFYPKKVGKKLSK